MERSRQVYRLRTQVLRLGFSYLSSSSVVEAAQPVLEQISEELHESSSMSMLDGGQIVYVARSAASRILAAGLSVGSRLPAYCTSMGRVLLAALPDEELAAYLRDLKPRAHTPKTITRIPQIRKAILQVRKDCYAIVDEELEAGLRSIAVPVFTRGNRVVAAINVGTHISRVDRAHTHATAASPLCRKAPERCAAYSSDPLEPMDYQELHMPSPVRADHVGSFLRPAELLRARTSHIAPAELEAIEDRHSSAGS